MAEETLDQRIQNCLRYAVGFDGTCFRSSSRRYANQQDVLSVAGSLKRGGRYNFKGKFGVLYLSCDRLTCLEETTQLSKSEIGDFPIKIDMVIVAVEVSLSRVLDLTNSEVQKVIGISQSDLTQIDWEHIQETEGKEAITQTIGRLAKDAGFEAILVPSSVCLGKNLDVFAPDKLIPPSKTSLINPHLLPVSALLQ